MRLSVISRLDLINLESGRLVKVQFGKCCLDDTFSALVHLAHNSGNELFVVDLTVAILVKESEDGRLLLWVYVNSVVFESLNEFREIERIGLVNVHLFEASLDSIDALGATTKNLFANLAQNLVWCLDWSGVILIVETSS